MKGQILWMEYPTTCTALVKSFAHLSGIFWLASLEEIKNLYFHILTCSELATEKS